MTFSISARCAKTGMFGIAVSSSSPCVAARCAHARAGVGVVATQNITDPTLGPLGLDLMASGLSATDAMERIKSQASHLEYRQLALVDGNGGGAAFSGRNTLGTHRTVIEPNVVAAGNLLSNAAVPEKMVEAFLMAEGGSLGSRLIKAMRAALAAGGEEGPVHSVGMLLVREVAWPVADLRVDWHETDPIGELSRLWELWEPQLDAYVSRGINPSVAPSYGVPGDL
ncbi:DUF1028 domain-containing protein [Aminobacter niigataensis]|uniref:DUF1028 domain-containing protein n=1 Tax=Aminobacter niigataensis TaxID=83265 RepID=UPI0022835022|nr:DUF1028 domain-containing protein [Aminobacter niigataensis]CAI2936521.1 conserved protein of unknown function [Aminobacter niigataensis]